MATVIFGINVKKVALYCRVSTNHQDLSLQENDLRKFCLQRGFLIFKEYTDTISGGKESRPSLNQLMSAARKRHFDAIIVWRFDRFARSTKHLTLALNEFKSLGIDFISYQENVDTSTPMGQAMFTIISAIAQLERDIIRERVLAGLINAKEKGVKLGRPSKRNDYQIRVLFEKGMTYREIAHEVQTSIATVQRSLSKSSTR